MLPGPMAPCASQPPFVFAGLFAKNISVQSLADGVYVVVSGPTIVVAELRADVALVDFANVDILPRYR